MYSDGILFDARTLELKYQMPAKRIEKFFKGLEEGEIFATKCNKCGEMYFPPQADCPKCRASDMSWEEISGNAVLETFTIIESTPASFQKYGKYAVAVGKMENGLRVLSWLETDDISKIKVGMKMTLITKRNDEGNLMYVFKIS